VLAPVSGFPVDLRALVVLVLGQHADERGRLIDVFARLGQRGVGAALRDDQLRSHPTQLRTRAVASPHRAHPDRLGRRASGANVSRTCGDDLLQVRVDARRSAEEAVGA
jgi:hypothetical protein